MKQTWRWFGSSDPVSLAHIRQTGATGVVTALHHLPNGAVWPRDEIERRRSAIEAAGMQWSVVESLPVSEAIKTATGHWREHLDAYRQSLRNLAAAGVRTVCYNFMPVLDWTRTDLAFAMADGSLALRFDADAFAAFDLFILGRAEAPGQWHQDQIRRARAVFDALSDSSRAQLTRTIISGLPGAEEHFTLENFRDALATYRDIGDAGLRENLKTFIQSIAPVATEAGVRLCIHPDDPPFPLLGLPRILSTAADVQQLFAASDVPANGLTFCTGSFGVRPDNDLPAMVRAFGPRIFFAHLRSTRREPCISGQPSFHEADHLDGDVDMVAVIQELLREERRRKGATDSNDGGLPSEICMRPDHGHQMLDDLNKKTNPGYSAIGRLRGLAELRGVVRAIEYLENTVTTRTAVSVVVALFFATFGAAKVRALVDSPASIGATVPWISYEAEDSTTSGTILGPDYSGQTPAREASGRRCVQLAHVGDHLEFVAKADAQAMVIRYCIPDSPDGVGIDATLSLYINRVVKQKLPLTSRSAYLYGNYPFSNDPRAGTPRHFWDEARLMPGTIHSGDVIRLEKDEDDSAANYWIDLVDLEQVASPLDEPANALSVVDFGADPGGKADARPAFLATISAAKSQQKSVWIPKGRFLLRGSIEVSDVSLRGAGMWYSNLIGGGDDAPEKRVAIAGGGSNVTLADFAIDGTLNYRNDAEPNDGLGGSFGTGSTIRNIWVEHTKTGAWLVNSDGLQVENCRFRDTIADGINLCVGMRNTTVRNCTVRGSGDDCFAVWPADYAKASGTPGSNHFVNCTAQCPFLAQGFSIYGGAGNTVDHCQAIDIPYGAGLFASTTFPTQVGFDGMTSFTASRVERAGDIDGAIGLVANRSDLTGLFFNQIDVLDSVHDGIKLTCMNGHSVSKTVFENVGIVNAGLGGEGSGIAVTIGAVGSASLSRVHIEHPKTAAVQNDSSGFRFIRVENTTAVGTPVRTN